MSPKFQLAIYFIFSIVISILCPHIIFAFASALLLAYIAQPLLLMMESYIKIPKVVLVFILIFVFLCLFYICLTQIIPILYQQIMLFAPQVPMYLGILKEKIIAIFGEQSKILDNGFVEYVISIVDNFNNTMIDFGIQYINNILHYTFATINFITMLVLIPIIFFYYAKDFDSIINATILSFPYQYRMQVRQFLGQLGYAVNVYIKGQFSVCLILFIYYFIGLSIIGLNFAFVIALLTALLIIVPVIGFIVGAGLALLICFFDYGQTTTLLYTAILYILGYGIESLFVTPKIIGQAIKLHPLLLLFGTMIFGSLFGILGLIFAAPAVAALSVTIKFIWQTNANSTIDDNQITKKI